VIYCGPSSGRQTPERKQEHTLHDDDYDDDRNGSS